jgi:hypothetical protein
MVFPKLPRGITQRFERLGDGEIARLKPHWRARDSEFRQAGAFGCLTGDERRPPGGAAVLGVVVGEHHALAGDAVDVRRLVTHHAERIGADIGLADVVAHDEEDVWSLSAWRCGRRGRLCLRGPGEPGCQRRSRRQRSSAQQQIAPLQSVALDLVAPHLSSARKVRGV